MEVRIEPKIIQDGHSIGMPSPFYGINVEYHNRGVLAADGLANLYSIIPVKGEFSEDKEKRLVVITQDTILNDPKWPSLLEAARGVEYDASDTKTGFFTIPNSNNDPLFQTAESYFKSDDPSKRIYVIATLKYKDQSLTSRVRIVTESCVYFLGNDIAPMHICGRNRTFLEEVSK